MTGIALINMRVRSVMPLALFSAYVFAFIFEGTAFYHLVESYGGDPVGFVMLAVTGECLGLLAGGLLVKNSRTAKRVMMGGMGLCSIFAGVFFFPPSGLWAAAMTVSAAVSGVVIAAWGCFLKDFTPSGQRIKSCADVLIYSNILMILVDFVAVNFSPFVGLGLALALIILAIVCAALLPPEKETIVKGTTTAPKKVISIKAPLTALVIFVVVITINSGLMYQMIVPAFAHLTSLTSWYWAVPYIVALVIMRNLHTGRAFSLYLGMVMIVSAFILFVVLDRGPGSYIVVDTLMLGACGIFDLFWWSILGEMLDLSDRPARVVGIGLAANVFGILWGNLLALLMSALALPASSTTIVALTVVCATAMLLPPLNLRLAALLKNHTYLSAFSVLPPAQQQDLVHEGPIYEPLTPREQDVLVLVLNGKTNKAIAMDLNLSENTVKTHLQNIYGKYQVTSRLKLVSMLLKRPGA